jgi:hypothetical protein
MKTKIGQGPEFIERRVYYGYLDQENSNRYANHVRTSWQFECILKNTFDKTPDTRVLKSPDHDFALVRILTTRGRFHRTLTRQQPSTGKWYTLQLGTIGVPAWHYELGDDGYVELENARGYVEHIMPVTPEQDAQLRLAFDSRSLQPTTADAISNAVVSPQFHPRGVAVYDVGQGAAAAIIDNDFRPRIYFDIGRPLPFHKASEPPKLKFCFRLDQLIIISHWDFDHMYAGYKDRRAKPLRWIAPEQVLSPHKLKFARELASNGKLFLWPSSLRAISTPFGELRKCTGTGPNDSGLMLIATVYPTPQSRADVLLSGDADYQYIPEPFNPLHRNGCDPPWRRGQVRCGTTSCESSPRWCSRRFLGRRKQIRTSKLGCSRTARGERLGYTYSHCKLRRHPARKYCFDRRPASGFMVAPSPLLRWPVLSFPYKAIKGGAATTPRRAPPRSHLPHLRLQLLAHARSRRTLSLAARGVRNFLTVRY